MIGDILKEKKLVCSLEVFPPKKTDDVQLVYDAIDEMKVCRPDFISVTYGAGGGTSKETLAIASYIKNSCGIESLAHLTCAALTQESLVKYTDSMKANGLKNILVLRGDKPRDISQEQFDSRYYKHASDLAGAIKGEFFIAGACYPEKHPDAVSIEEDIRNLKKKIDAGVSMLTSQMFFDNEKFYRFIEMTDAVGINVPIMAGIMPITTANQVKTMIELSNASTPVELLDRIEKYRDNPDDLRKAGIEYAIMQKLDLIKHGVKGIHLYAMNKPDVAKTFFNAS